MQTQISPAELETSFSRVAGGRASAVVVFALLMCSASTNGQDIRDRLLTSNYPDVSLLLLQAQTIPDMREGLVPQGIAYVPHHDWIVVSAWHDDHRTASVLHFFKLTDGLHLGTVPLKFGDQNMVGRVGGAAWCQGKLWLASEGHLLRIACPTQEQVALKVPLEIEKLFSVDSATTSLSASGDQLWVGEISLGTAFPTAPHHHLRDSKAWAALYSVSADSELKSQAAVQVDGRQVLVPEAVVLIPNKVRGFALRGDHLVLSFSYSLADSTVEFFRSPLTTPGFDVSLPGGGKTVGYDLPKTPVFVARLPAMAMDVEWAGDQLIIPFQAAARPFGSQWQRVGSVIEDRFYRLRVPQMFLESQM